MPASTNKQIITIALTLLFAGAGLAQTVSARTAQSSLEQLRNHNNKIRTYHADIKTDGRLKGKRFQSYGEIWSDIGKRRFKIRFTELILKSPISIFLMKGNRIVLYYPRKKKKVVTNRYKFRPAYDAGIPLSARLLEPMMQGHFYIPNRLTYLKYYNKSRKLILADRRHIINYKLNDKGLPREAYIKKKSKGRAIKILFDEYRRKKGVWVPYYIKIYPRRSSHQEEHLAIEIKSLQINSTISNVWNLK
jgi:hypothetical protein